MADVKKIVREPIATWYEISDYRPEINAVRVVAFTEKFVTCLRKEWTFSGPDRYRERRERRNNIFPTFDAAKSEIVRRGEEKVDSSKMRLQKDRAFLGQVESLKEPA